MIEEIKFRIELLKHLWQQRNRNTEDEYYLPMWEMNLYRLKCAICLFLPNQPPPYKDHLTSVMEGSIIVAYTNGGVHYSSDRSTVHWFEALIVGFGWRNWWWDMYSDSD